MVVSISFWDDTHPLPPGIRFLIQTCAAVILITGGFSLSELVVPGLGTFTLGWVGIPFSLLYILWMINLYNFMDGLDGFAGGMGSFGFGFLALLGWMAGEMTFFTATLIIAASNLGFLVSNFPPARIFMGDVGSIPMGFLVASFSLWGVRDGIFDFWVAVLTFSPFIADATFTLIGRGLKKKKIWLPHRSHYYQRLVLSGWGHKKTVLCEHILMFVMGGLAVFLHIFDNEWVTIVGLVSSCFIYFSLAKIIDKKTSNPKPISPPLCSKQKKTAS